MSLRTLAALLLAGTAATLSCADEVVATPIPDTHPFVGRWRFNIPDSACFEEYRVRPDGRRSATSGSERVESEFAMALRPDARGFYKWTDKVVGTNGQPDCGGEKSPLGDVATHYVLFTRDHKRFIVCLEPSIAHCFGPYVRLEDNAL